MAGTPVKGGLKSGKVSFVGGEKVLCYEPDPNKVKILYEAKILEVQNTMGPGGKKQLVHFTGWNRSWNRYMLEDKLLKDVSENREWKQQLEQEAMEQMKMAKKC